ncbi:MAG: DNA polymerase III subunit delta [Burkholderiales bacterium]|nr:DNA polymerase III subunit delta [Burkholderiales bacterium]
MYYSTLGVFYKARHSTGFKDEEYMQNLINYLSTPTPFNSVLIHTAEEYSALMDYYLDCLRDKIGSSRHYKFNADRYFKYSEINDIINNRSLFDERVYIEIHYKSKPVTEGQKNLSELIKNLESGTYLTIICNKLAKSDLNSTWVKTISNSGNVFSLTLNDVPEIIKHYLEQNNQTIAKNAIELILELNQGNFNQLMQIVKQLGIVYPNNHNITLDDVKQFSANNSQYNIYQLSNAYLTGNLAHSMQILNNIYQKPEDAILIQWLINEDIKKLIRTKAKLKLNYSFEQIILELKIRRTDINLYRNAHQRLSYTTLINLLNEVAELDMIIKGVINRDIQEHLSQIIHKLCG